MHNETTVKRSPIVLIRMFIGIEFLGFICYALAAALGNYKYEVYSQFFFSQLISYQTAKFFFLSGVQLVITIYAFLRWHYETYVIEPQMISHNWGVFFKKEEKVPLREIISVTLTSGPLGKRLHYGSITIRNAASSVALTLADISYPKKYSDLISELLKIPTVPPTGGFLGAHPDVRDLIQKGEHAQLEFKSSLRFDYQNRRVNPELEKAALKTVAAFLNANGGNLVIGVDNDRNILGLANDFGTLKHQNTDGFEQHFTHIFNKMIGPEFRHCVSLLFHKIGDHDLCVVETTASNRPVYLKADGTEYFYVRTGNITTPLKLSEVESYSRSRWSRQRSLS